MDRHASAIPFVQHRNGSFVVEPEAVEVLSSIEGKVAVVAVVGPYRTGKSFLLNSLSQVNFGEMTRHA